MTDRNKEVRDLERNGTHLPQADMVIRGDDDFNWGVLLMTKEIQIGNVILTDSELKGTCKPRGSVGRNQHT